MASIVVVDYGSQYTRLITRRLRELSVYSEIVGHDVTTSELERLAPAGVILSGGPASVMAPGAPGLPAGLLEREVPVLAICYGMHLLARELGGQVETRSHDHVGGKRGEYGKAELAQYGGSLFEGVEGEFVAWMSHGDSVVKVPNGFEVTATTDSGLIAAMEDTTRQLYCLQFHPEVRHTPKGTALLERFVDATGLERDWTAENIVQEAVTKVRAAVGSQRVLLAISGGVDSSTLGLLLHRAIGDQLVAVFVDHGLLRLGEAEEVERSLRALGVDLHVVDARERFLRALAGVSDPETKRKIIGGEFIKVFAEQARAFPAAVGNIRYLAQGTLYPDVIESAGAAGAANIKSHHNVGGLPADLGFDLIEPFRNLFKDEVREIAESLGLPPHLRDRHPFPGPGLAIRIIGEVTEERLELLARVDDVFVSALREFGLYKETWQALAVLTQVRSVGVMGDERSYGYLVALRAVTSIDGMTADWARLPHDFLATVSSRIVNSVPEVNRVVYDITSKPPGTIEWE